jgi:hypothetical protein
VPGLKLAWRKVVEPGHVETSSAFPFPTASAELPVGDLGDTEPGDRGRIEYFLSLDEEPAVLSLTGSVPQRTDDVTKARRTETETQQHPSGSQVGETVETTISYLETDADAAADKAPATTVGCCASLASILWLCRVDPGIQLDGARTATTRDIVLGHASPTPFEEETIHGLRIDWVVRPTMGDRSDGRNGKFRFGFDATPASPTR